MADTGLSPERLCLEVTEHSVIRDMAQATEQMNQLRDLGVRLAVDDFGTGFASMRYLQLMPVDTLKIDRCFVDGLPDDSTDVSITRATIAMARSMGLEVIAEGIESETQARFLGSEGVIWGQGWHYAKPAPFSAFSGFASRKI
jgi:sensor c-di-GMP phosphodiesterase-like protein